MPWGKGMAARSSPRDRAGSRLGSDQEEAGQGGRRSPGQSPGVSPGQQVDSSRFPRGGGAGSGRGGASATHSDTWSCTLTSCDCTKPTWPEATCRPRNQGRPGT